MYIYINIYIHIYICIEHVNYTYTDANVILVALIHVCAGMYSSRCIQTTICGDPAVPNSTWLI